MSTLLVFGEYIKTIGLTMSMTSNPIILCLLFFRSPPSFGSYRYLMISYAFVEIIYSFSYWISEMAAHSTDTTYVLFRIIREKHRTYEGIKLLQFCSMYITLISILCVHFIYRYIVLCRGNIFHHFFSTTRLWFWVLSCPTVGIVVGVAKYHLLEETDYATEILRPEFQKYYNLSMEFVVYNGPIYKVCNGLDHCHTPKSSIFGMSLIIGLLIICLTIMTFCGYRCYNQLTIQKFLSERTKNLQKQLFRALLIQSLIPIFFMYIPISLVFIFPAFGIRIGVYSNIAMFCLAIYPPIDQFAIIFVIREFREIIGKAVNRCITILFRDYTVPTTVFVNRVL